MNVRWDAVVSHRHFTSCTRTAVGTPAAAEAASASGSVEVRVRLFGMLVGPEVTNPVVLQFPAGCALRDVLEELGRRLGPGFMRTLVSGDGEWFNTCRLFIDGESVNDMATLISPRAAAAATIEIILLREIEGG